MATGKTVVGCELATRLSMPFCDLDQRIENETGTSVANLFANYGEQQFRQLERKLLNQVIKECQSIPMVVACGGGTGAFSENMMAMRAVGLVVELSAPIEVVLNRIAVDGASVRPLSSSVTPLTKLLERRLPVYRQAHASVHSHLSSAVAIAKKIEGLVRLAQTIESDLPNTSICSLAESAYPIINGLDSLDRLGDLLAMLTADNPPTKIAVVTDKNVAPHYLNRVIRSLERALERAGCEVVSETIASGEGQKTASGHAALAESLVAHGLDRKSMIVALGGGVVGDLAGFVAASLFRGIRLIQVPTSLLAMIDSSIGGKTGVNLGAGKNLLGAFWQPQLVLIDPCVLSSLPPREWRAGMGEMIKYGLLDGAELYESVEAYALAPDDAEKAMRVIGRCAAYKSWIVSRDEREQTGERAQLNLGHTVGHAIERAAGYDGTMVHGEAVALGLIAAARVAATLGLAKHSLEQRIVATIEAIGLSSDLDSWLRPEVLRHLRVDKKRTGSQIEFIAPGELGQTTRRPIEVDELTKILLQSSAL